MQEYDSLYDEAHDLLWGNHFTRVLRNGAMIEAELRWGLPGPEIGEVCIDKYGCDSEDIFYWASQTLNESYALPTHVEKAIMESDEYVSFALRIDKVNKEVKSIQKEKGDKKFYQQFLNDLEDDPDNNKVMFHKSLTK
jgi:hypothetical protein